MSCTTAPVMIPTTSCIDVSFGSTIATRLPSRWMWMRSAISNTCGMLWLIRITGRPLSRTRLMSSSTCPDSRTPSAAVGSSMITSLRAHAAARATATPWRWPPESVSTAWLMDRMPICRLFICLSASSFMPLWSSMRNTLPSGPSRRFSRPRNRLVAMSSAGATARSW